MKVFTAVILGCLVCSCTTTQPASAPERGADRSPRFIVYYNSDATPLLASRSAIYSHVIVSFVRVTVDEKNRLQLVEPEHMDGQWHSIRRLQAAGKVVLVSFGGGLAETAEYTALVGREAEAADVLGRWIRKRHFDGIDIDFEASAMFHQKLGEGVGDGRKFLIALTSELRRQLPAPRYVITHAPEPPYLNPLWHGGPWLDILAAVGEAVDWITVQYYNNGPYDDPVPVAPPSNLGKTGYAGLVAPDGHLRWPAHKVVIGKPIYKADAGSGHLAPDELIDTIVMPMLAAHGGDFGGLAGWEFSDKTDDHRAWNDRVGLALIQARNETAGHCPETRPPRSTSPNCTHHRQALQRSQ